VSSNLNNRVPRDQAKIPSVRNWRCAIAATASASGRLLKVLTRNGIRAHAALSSEVCAWMGTLSGFDTPAVSAPFFAGTNSDAADPLSLNHYGSTYRFIDSRDTFSEGHPVVSPASAMRR
jgi:hypothetical protein